MNEEIKKEESVNEEIKTQLEDNGYEFAVAVATQAEIENGAACGQLSIIVEELS